MLAAPEAMLGALTATNALDCLDRYVAAATLPLIPLANASATFSLLLVLAGLPERCSAGASPVPWPSSALLGSR